jgi:hypothetical protein
MKVFDMYLVNTDLGEDAVVPTNVVLPVFIELF